MAKFLILVLVVFAAPLAAQLNSIQNVYVLPMGSGLDQYLANRLAAAGVFQVVTEPLRADAVFTDRLGEVFEARFAELYIAPEEAKKKAEEKKAKAEEKRARAKARKEGKDQDEDEPAEEDADSGKLTEQTPIKSSSFGRGRGTLFLVERKSQTVVWSIYEQPKDSSPKEMDRTAGRIVDKLKKDRTGK